MGEITCSSVAPSLLLQLGLHVRALKADMERVMTTPPVWADGLPLAVEASAMERYGK